MFPAHAGMDRAKMPFAVQRGRVPRARGDGPASGRWVQTLDGVFPAHAGMDHNSASPRGSAARVPRARGDGPPTKDGLQGGVRCSPRTRGWTQLSRIAPNRRIVFPAHAGMDRSPTPTRLRRRSVPRARGDGPVEANEGGKGAKVFPAHAGMDRDKPSQDASRGGVCQGPALLSTPGATVIVHFRSRWARVKG